MTASTANSAPSYPSRMRARALVSTELIAGRPGVLRTRISRLRSEGAVRLRPTIAREAEPWPSCRGDVARVCLAAGAAGPMGGDEITVDVDVGTGSTLVLIEASATLLLPGHDDARSVLRVRARVAPGATLVWLPEPMIASRACHHVNDVTVDLDGDARLFLREELLLGRRGEGCGRLRQKVRVRRDGRAMYAQDLCLGADSTRSSAVLGEHRAVGSILLVDPDLPRIQATCLAEDGVLLPLRDSAAVLVQALSRDSIGLRSQLAAGLAVLGPPWDPNPPIGTEPVQSIQEPR